MKTVPDDNPKKPISSNDTITFSIKKPKINPPKINKPKPGTNKILKVLAVVLVIFAVGFFGGWLGSRSQSYNKQAEANTEAARTTVVNESELISELAKTVGEGVVSVNVKTQQEVQGVFGNRNMEQSGAGTGFIISKEGIVVTNRHVVPTGTNEVSIVLSDGTELDNVKVIGRTNASDPLDVAFLKIEDSKGKELKPVKIGDSSKMRVGDKVIAIGNALGQFQNTVTSGIVSGYGRKIQASDGSGNSTETLQNLFQTDAAINQGNSGGPLVNMNGEVIGINTAVAGDGAENIGFSIPINDVKGIIETVLTSGKFERPYLGVKYVELNDDYAYEFNLDRNRGAYLAPSRNGSTVIKDSPAAKAGLKEKDIIIKINGEEINENNSLISLVQKNKVGETIDVTVVRDGKEEVIKVKLEAAPQE